LTKNFLPIGPAIFCAAKKLKKNIEATLYSLAVSGLHYLCIEKSTSDMDNITLKISMTAHIIPRLHRRRAETKKIVSGNAHYTD